MRTGSNLQSNNDEMRNRSKPTAKIRLYKEQINIYKHIKLDEDQIITYNQNKTRSKQGQNLQSK